MSTILWVVQCTPHKREVMRSLTLSFDVYRYCVSVIRKAASVKAESGIFTPKPDLKEQDKICRENIDLVVKANKIAEKVFQLDDFNHSAPWLYDSYCRAANLPLGGGPISDRSRQLVIVSTKDWSATTGTMTLYERDTGGEWQRYSKVEETQVVLGINGLGWGRGNFSIPVHDGKEGPVKVEGDGRAPAGLFDLGDLFTAPNTPPIKMDAIKTDSTMYCDDRRGSKSYNKLITMDDKALAECRQSKSSEGCPSEALLREDDVYKRFIWIHHNDESVNGAGSCIFLHQNHPELSATAGCTTISEGFMEKLMTWLDPKMYPLLLQMPELEIKKRKERWKLP